MDLGNLVNGWRDNPVDFQLFDCHFNAKQIMKTWIAVGYMTMTGNTANDPKVRYKLGEGGGTAGGIRLIDCTAHIIYKGRGTP